MTGCPIFIISTVSALRRLQKINRHQNIYAFYVKNDKIYEIIKLHNKNNTIEVELRDI